MTTDLQINADSKALVHFNVLLKDGSAADSTRVNGKPVWCVFGDGSLTEVIEKSLMGLKAGDEKKLEVHGSEFFGPANPDDVHFMDINQFSADVKLEEGAIIAFEDMMGGTVPGMIREIQGHSVKVDFNHPLADQDIILEIEIVEVRQ